MKAQKIKTISIPYLFEYTRVGEAVIFKLFGLFLYKRIGEELKILCFRIANDSVVEKIPQQNKDNIVELNEKNSKFYEANLPRTPSEADVVRVMIGNQLLCESTLGEANMKHEIKINITDEDFRKKVAEAIKENHS